MINPPRTPVVLVAGLLTGIRLFAAEPDLVIADFESADFGSWRSEGTAFGSRPLHDGTPHPIKLTGFMGKGLAGSVPGGETATGALLSPEFSIQRKFINFLIWGERNLPAEADVELHVEDRAVRAASATESFDPERRLHWRTWDVADLAGRRASLRVHDRSTTGAIAVDHFVQSDEPESIPVDAITLFQESLRPQFHFTARAGWLNDANGMLHFNGQWHLFHQHRPPGSPAVLWGHAVSDDLLHWRHRPVAIPAEDRDAIFSGSGLVDWENASGLKHGDHPPILLFYTLHPPGGSGRKATQCLAFSTDGGQSFEKYSGNPLLRTPDFNDRDPKVFFHKPSRAWFMVLSLSMNNVQRDQATYGLFRSADLKSWKLLQRIGPGAWYWECPDMFELPVKGDRNQTKWLLMKGSGDYIIGSFDGNAFKPETEPIRTQWGGSYYGAQTFSDAPGGRRIQIAWMNTPKTNAPNSWPGMPFNQQMSFPREFSLRMTPEGPRVFRYPIPEIEQLYAKRHAWKARTLEPGENALTGIQHDLLDIDMVIELKEAKQVNLTLRGEGVIYDAKERKLKAFGRAVSLAPVDGKLILRALLDRTSIELFGNHGEVTHSGLFFPNPLNRNLELTVQAGSVQVHRLAVHELRSIWP